jgi:hypothetical protein
LRFFCGDRGTLSGLLSKGVPEAIVSDEILRDLDLRRSLGVVPLDNPSAPNNLLRRSR